MREKNEMPGSVIIELDHFFPMFPFHLPETIRKFSFFYFFQGDHGCINNKD